MSALSRPPKAEESDRPPRSRLGARLVARALAGPDRAGLRGAARGSILGVDLALGQGLHVVLGSAEDGTIALGDLIAGRRRPTAGVVAIDGEEPWRTPSLRARVAHLAEVPELPEARLVVDSMRAALAARGAAADAAPGALDAIGAGPLAGRRLASLTHGEARAVDLALALTLTDPSVAVLHEPFADVSAGSEAAIERRVRDLAGRGTCVVVLTSSPRDAARLGDDLLVLERGRLVRGASAGGEGLLDPAPWPGARPRRFELIAHLARRAGEPRTASAREVAMKLAESRAVSALAWDEPQDPAREPAWVRIAGPDESACALALAEAIEAAGAELVALSPVPATLVEVRTATEQLRVAATWYAREHAMPPHDAVAMSALASPPAPVEVTAEASSEPQPDGSRSAQPESEPDLKPEPEPEPDLKPEPEPEPAPASRPPEAPT